MTSTLNKRSFNLTVFVDRVVIHTVFFRWPSYFAPQYLDAKKKSLFLPKMLSPSALQINDLYFLFPSQTKKKHPLEI